MENMKDCSVVTATYELGEGAGNHRNHRTEANGL